MKTCKVILSWVLTLCLLITPFYGSISFASAAQAPTIKFNRNMFDNVTSTMPITVTMKANGGLTLTACDVRLEGTSIGTTDTVTFTPADYSLAVGSYTLIAQATDSDGVTAHATLSFNVCDKADIDFTYADDESIVPSVDGATAAIYNVESLDYTMGYGATTDGTIAVNDSLQYDDKRVYEMKYWNMSLEESSVSGIPYQTFEVALNGKTDGEVAVRYTGSTLAGERIALKVYNPSTQAWDSLGTFYGSDSVSATVDVATYAYNDNLQLVAVLDYVTNGSDTMIWSTDPQHYTKFADLNEYYYQVYQYAAEQYLAGNAGYIITTGDLVDDRPSAAVAAAQWDVADKAMTYVDEVGMPNGLVSGNHDVGDYKKPDYTSGTPTSDYSKFWEHFPASRYNTQPWFGGSLNNNVSHYDLITIGNVDFIVMYLGYGLEATDETIAWANDVLERYSHRTAIITTHQYLDAGAAIRPSASRAQLIFDKIVDPNPNVVAVLCGHDDGSLCLEKTASDGRTVYEILCDYQFVEAEDPDFYENEHYIGSVPHCCGDGYIRLMSVSGDTLSSITYSPITGRYNPYGDRENISIDLNSGAPTRLLSTVAFSAYIPGDEMTTDYPEGDTAIIIKSPTMTTYHHVAYYSYPTEPTEYGTYIPVDWYAYQDLYEEAQAIDLTPYTEESANALREQLNVVTPGVMDTQLYQELYVALAEAIGALELYVEPISKDGLKTMHNYDFTLSKWKNYDANIAITSVRSYITATATEAGGIHMKKSSVATNDWPSALYKTENIVLKPVNGKIYVDLDVMADSAWCIYMEVQQANKSAAVRLNFAIENAFNSTTSDGYQGYFKGIYDVTEAFTENGLDPYASMTVNRTLLYIVPGEVTYDHIELLTETTNEPVDTSELKALVDQAKALDKTLYTPSTWTALQEALPSAEVILIDPTATQSDVNLGIMNLQLVLNSMKLVADVVVEPEGSLLPGDEGLWVPNAKNVMTIYRNEDKHTVLQNTNSEWPYADYTYAEPMVVSVADHQISFDITVGSATNIFINADNNWITLSKYISAANTSGEDLQKGTYKVDIPLSSISQLAGKETVTLRATRVYSVGGAAESAVTLRQMQITDYVAPPPVADTYLSFMPETMADTSTAATAGSHELYAGDLYIHSDAENGYRMQIIKDIELYDLTKLNAIHLNVDSEVPFKIAFHIQSYTDNTNQWFTTSDSAYSNLYTVESDRVNAGSYDVYLDILSLVKSIQDKTSVYMVSVTIVTNGEGTFRLKDLEAMYKDAFAWPTGITYGAAATPDNPYMQHCAKEAPNVAHKVDLLDAIGLSAHPSVTAWAAYGNNALNLNIDLTKTPYLYYSVAVPEGSNFCFSLYNNSNYSPWLMFRDGTGNGAFLNKDAANWDAYANREQYITTSETGCIDMRQHLKNPNTLKWIVNQIAFYNSTGKNDVVSYMFFGSEPLPAPEIGDVDGDGQMNMNDALSLYSFANGRVEITKENIAYADVTNDGEVNMLDALILYNVINGVLPPDTIQSYYQGTN